MLGLGENFHYLIVLPSTTRITCPSFPHWFQTSPHHPSAFCSLPSCLHLLPSHLCLLPSRLYLLPFCLRLLPSYLPPPAYHLPHQAVCITARHSHISPGHPHTTLPPRAHHLPHQAVCITCSSFPCQSWTSLHHPLPCALCAPASHLMLIMLLPPASCSLSTMSSSLHHPPVIPMLVLNIPTPPSRLALMRTPALCSCALLPPASCLLLIVYHIEQSASPACHSHASLRHPHTALPPPAFHLPPPASCLLPPAHHLPCWVQQMPNKLPLNQNIFKHLLKWLLSYIIRHCLSYLGREANYMISAQNRVGTNSRLWEASTKGT